MAKVPPKSAASARFVPVPVTAKAAELIPVVSPVRVTVKVKAVFPVLPSFLRASVAAIARAGGGTSSLVIVPVAVAVVIVALVGLLRVILKVSSGSNTVSALTGTVMT